jgi:DNA modification methylase
MGVPQDWRERCTLLQADYRDTLQAAAGLGGADLVLTSPPYCDARTYGAAVSWTMDDYRSLGDAVFGALKPGGHALVNLDAPIREWRPGFGSERGFHPWKVMIDWGERVGFRVPDRLAFGRHGQVGRFPGRFRNDWEPLLWFVRPGGKPWLDQRAIDRPGVRQRGRKVTSHRLKDGRTQTQAEKFTGRTLPGNLWNYGACGTNQTGALDIEATDHPARWPFKLAEDLVRCFCPPDGLACDPFVGAGTSAVAALEHGRRFVGGDLYSDQGGTPWVDVAAGILEARSKQLGLFAVAK